MGTVRMRPRGFTLLETIFSSLFIGVTVLAIVNLFPGAYLSIRQSETLTQADFVAKSILDEMRCHLSLEDGPNEPVENGEYVGVGPAFEPRTIEGIVYTPKVELFDVPGLTDDASRLSIRGVRVTITYRLSFSEKKVVHETYIHRLTIRRTGFNYGGKTASEL